MRRIAYVLILAAAVVGLHACAADAPTNPGGGGGGNNGGGGGGGGGGALAGELFALALLVARRRARVKAL